MKYHYTDIGYCRIYFTPNDGRTLYCLQEEMKDVWCFYICYDDEPGHEVPIPKGLEILDNCAFAQSAKHFLRRHYESLEAIRSGA